MTPPSAGSQCAPPPVHGFRSGPAGGKLAPLRGVRAAPGRLGWGSGFLGARRPRPRRRGQMPSLAPPVRPMGLSGRAGRFAGANRAPAGRPGRSSDPAAVRSLGLAGPGSGVGPGSPGPALYRTLRPAPVLPAEPSRGARPLRGPGRSLRLRGFRLRKLASRRGTEEGLWSLPGWFPFGRTAGPVGRRAGILRSGDSLLLRPLRNVFPRPGSCRPSQDH